MAEVAASSARIACAALAVSGFAALGCEIVWTRQGALWLGQESASILAILAAFFGGLGCGAALLGRRIERSTRPARWFAACEAVIGIWTLLIAALMPTVSTWLLAASGAEPSPWRQWSIAFGGTFLLLLPATAAMGASIPAMQRIFASPGRPERLIGLLYAANTAGAVIGVLATAFILVPMLGLVRTSIVCATLNAVCAALVLRTLDVSIKPAPPTTRRVVPIAYVPLAISGLLGIGYQVLAVRALAQVAHNTVYTFAIALAVYLVGTALGAAVHARIVAGHDRREPQGSAGGAALLATSMACLTGVFAIAHSLELARAIQGASAAPGFGHALIVEAVVAAAVLLLPTTAMGILFAELCGNVRRAGASLGAAFAANTLGAAFAPVLIGVILMPSIGLERGVACIALGYALLAASRRERGASGAVVLALGCAAIVIRPLHASLVPIPPHGRLVHFEQGAAAHVSVVENRAGVRFLHIDNRPPEGSSATLHADARQALLPLLLHPAPRRVLFLGLGTGVTSVVAAADDGAEVTTVELLPEVARASRLFRDALAAEGFEAQPRIILSDARRFVRRSSARWDLIVADNVHPARDGSAALHTLEHFEAVRDRLAPTGLFCQWLPLHQLDLDSLRAIVRAFQQVFPEAHALLATHSLETPVLGLLGTTRSGPLDARAVEERIRTLRIPGGLASFGIDGPLDVLGSFIAGPAALSRYASTVRPNTDDLNFVTHRAPRLAYAPDSTPGDRLAALLEASWLEPTDLIDVAREPSLAPRLVAYWTARNRYLEIGRQVRPSMDPYRMLTQLREPLLSVLRTSPEFRPARDPLLRMAAALARDDAPAARELLAAIDRTNSANGPRR